MMSSVVRGRQYVYAASVRGTFQKVHRWSGVALQAILFGVPWITWGDHPMILLDLPHRRLFAFGQIFGATDTIFLVLIGLFLAFSLFILTALFGRLWCGYLCPQTVFLEEWVRRIEIAIEGERGQRMALDKGPWNLNKIWRKAAKWTAFAALAVVVAMTLASYFTPAPVLWSGQGSVASYAAVGALSVTMYLDFAWFREQFCNYLCPYARFQGALTDDHSLVITYDEKRGEPRHKGGGPSHGACIDCNKCVVVCPAGIDIRDGYQLECIACARCIDACESVMAKRETLPSLVQYTTQARTEGRTSTVWRPRTFVYGGLLSVIALTFAILIQNHHTLDASIARAPGTLYTQDADGGVRNTFLLRLANNHPDLDGTPDRVSVVVGGLDGAELTVQELTLKESERATVPLVVRVPDPSKLPRSVPITIRLQTDFDDVTLKTTFDSGEAVGPTRASDDDDDDDHEAREGGENG